MNRPAAIALLTLLATSAAAQQYTPSEEEKVAALKEAYRLNGNSMVSGAMIDLTAPRVVKTDRIMPAPPVVAAAPEPAPKPVRVAETNTCTRHHMRKVVTGSSWRCRK
jgi:hypothetical protein